jgi:uncharacterized protein YqhQ
VSFYFFFEEPEFPELPGGAGLPTLPALPVLPVLPVFLTAFFVAVVVAGFDAFLVDALVLVFLFIIFILNVTS